MIIDKNHPKFMTHVLVDEAGFEIEMVKSYNTETGETEIYLNNTDQGECVMAKVILKNARLVERHKVGWGSGSGAV